MTVYIKLIYLWDRERREEKYYMVSKILYIFDKRQKRNFVILGVLLLIGSFLELLGVSAIMPVINIITDETVIKSNKWYALAYDISGAQSVRGFILLLCVLLVLLYTIKNLYLVAENYLQHRYVYNNNTRLSVELYKAYLRKDYLFHTATNVADITRDITSDVEYLWSTVLGYLQFLTEGTTLLVLIIYLIMKDWVSTLCIGLIVGFASFIFVLIYRKASIKVGQENRLVSAERQKWILQGFGAIKDVKILEKENSFIKEYYETSVRSASVRIRYGVMGVIPRPFMEIACICSLMTAMAIKIVAGDDLMSFVPTIAVLVVAAFRMLPSFSKMVGYINTILYGKASIENIYEEIAEIRTFNQKIDSIQKDTYRFPMDKPLKVENITFSYPDSDLKVLDNASCIIEPNKTYGIIGTSGAGKSTLADIMLGLVVPQAGDVILDGQSIFKHTFVWHLSVGYIPQSIYLLDDTIRNNVAFGIPQNEINESKVWEVLEKAQVADFVRSQPKGLDTIVGDRGVMLSGGQRQRIGIARALYNDPKLLVLDEATSALDNDTEEAVVQSIEKLHGSMTLIIIAHRLTTIKHCDCIYKVDKGKISLCDKSEIYGKVH